MHSSLHSNRAWCPPWPPLAAGLPHHPFTAHPQPASPEAPKGLLLSSAFVQLRKLGNSLCWCFQKTFSFQTYRRDEVWIALRDLTRVGLGNLTSPWFYRAKATVHHLQPPSPHLAKARQVWWAPPMMDREPDSSVVGSVGRAGLQFWWECSSLVQWDHIYRILIKPADVVEGKEKIPGTKAESQHSRSTLNWSRWVVPTPGSSWNAPELVKTDA